MKPSVAERFCTIDEAVELIADGVTVACSGFVGAAHPEALTAAIERRFLRTGQPRDLTLVYAAGQGDGQSRGLNHLAHAGLLRRVIGGHWGLCPRLGELAMANQIEAYNFPRASYVNCFAMLLPADRAAQRTSALARLSIHFMVGGRLNQRTSEELVERIELGGTTWLWYKSMPMHVADPRDRVRLAREFGHGRRSDHWRGSAYCTSR